MNFKMEQFYRIAEISRQGYFKQQKKEIETESFMEKIKEAVIEIRKDHPRMGARPLHIMMNLKGHIGINRFETYLVEQRLGIVAQKSSYVTTKSNHAWFKYDNLLYGLKLTGINQVWGSDITYFLLGNKFYYINFIEDLYSRRILGYSVNNNMCHENNVNSLLDSIKQRNKTDYRLLIHHSDKGSQYCSKAYTELLQKNNIRISMANTSIENPYVERLNGILKNDYLYPRKQAYNLESLRIELDKVVWLYNNQRPHSQLKMLSPVEFENRLETTSVRFSFSKSSVTNKL